MYVCRWKPWLCAALAAVTLATPSYGAAPEEQGKGRGRSPSAAARQDKSGRVGTLARELPGYRAPAFKRGYDEGFERGRTDGRRGARYDPVESPEYRRADSGYAEAHGSREAYRTNYRAGFRQGYEDGYRDGTR